MARELNELTDPEIGRKREALRKEKDPASKERLARLEKEIAELKGDRDAVKAQWENEKSAIRACPGSEDRRPRRTHRA